jgi:hypothetical protein
MPFENPANDVEIGTDNDKNLIGFPHCIVLHFPQTAIVYISYLYLRNPDYLGRKGKAGCVKHQGQDFQFLLGKADGLGMDRDLLLFRPDKIDKNIENGVQITDESDPTPNPPNIITQTRLTSVHNSLNIFLLLPRYEEKEQYVPILLIQEPKKRP